MHEWVLNLLLDDRVIASSGTMTRQSSQFSKSFDLFLLKSLFLVQKQFCFEHALVSHSYTCNIMYKYLLNLIKTSILFLCAVNVNGMVIFRVHYYRNVLVHLVMVPLG